MVFSLQHQNVTKKSRAEPWAKSRRWCWSRAPSNAEERGTDRSGAQSVLSRSLYQQSEFSMDAVR